jgi:hypothetical protein
MEISWVDMQKENEHSSIVYMFLHTAHRHSDLQLKMASQPLYCGSGMPPGAHVLKAPSLE